MMDRETRQAVLSQIKAKARDGMGICLGPDLSPFSACFISASGRYFLVTAAHCLEEYGEGSALRVSTYRHQKPGVVVPLARMAKYASPVDAAGEPLNADVAVVELEAATADLLQVSWFVPKNSNSKHAGPGSIAVVAGFPKDHGGVTTGKRPQYHPGPAVYMGQVTERDPDPSLYRSKIDEAVDVFIEFDQQNTLDAFTDRPLDPFHPGGMSGGGVLAVPRPVEGELWSTGQVELAAIQSSYAGTDRLLRATRIEYAMALIEQMPA